MFDHAVYNLLKNKGWKNQSFLNSGTFTAPTSGVFFINGCGGGAGSGYWGVNSYSAGAGAACEMVPVYLNKDDAVTVTIGAGGVGITTGANTAGGTTSFGSYIILPGGQASSGAAISRGGLKTTLTAESLSLSLGGGMIAGASGGSSAAQPPGNSKFSAGSSSGSIWGGAGGWYGVGGNASTTGKGGNAAANTGAGGGVTSVSGFAGGDGGSGRLEVLWQE